MIVIPRRKLVILILFAVLFTVSIGIERNDEKTAFSESITKVIVVDAGHGLPDGGAVGMNGSIESELNIKIAKFLEKELTKKGFTVVMTRTDENTIAEDGGSIGKRKKEDMYKRLDIINICGADMAISIHMNKFTDSKYHGAQVIYSGNFPESKELASHIQKRLHNLPDNKSKRTEAKAPKGIFLLKNAKIPAVIVECGFISNYDEEKLLNTEKYQKELASAILGGIEDYYERYGSYESFRDR